MMTKIVYQTDSTTGEYRGPVTLNDSDLSPREPGVYLIPGGCVDPAPPEAPAGFVAIWGGKTWEVIEDHRGATVYMGGAATVIVDLGPLPEGSTSEPSPPTEAERWAALRAERDARLVASDVYVWADRWAGYTDAGRSAWTNYRQALRDLPETTLDPASPVWPEAPR